MLKKSLIVTLIVVSLIALIFILGTQGMDTIKETQIPTINLPEIDDGIYNGSFSETRWGVAVQVTVKNHLINKIKIKTLHWRGN